MKHILEICCDSVQSALNAMNSGADRIELCDNLIEGGTTPSCGTIAMIRDLLKIRMNVIVRPRGGDFLYDDPEYDIMMRDVEFCKRLGADGVVLGILQADGSIDIKRTAEIVKAAHPLPVTFHRAYDMTNDPYKAIEDVISTGATRLLSSGQKNKAAEGVHLLANLVKIAGDRLIVMPGSGLDDSNIEMIARLTGAKEFHLTGRKIIESKMTFKKEDINMGGIPGLPEYSRKVADAELIVKVQNILNNI